MIKKIDEKLTHLHTYNAHNNNNNTNNNNSAVVQQYCNSEIKRVVFVKLQTVEISHTNV